MNMSRLLVAICLMCMATTIALASNDAVDLGPASVSLDLSVGGSYSIAK